MVKDRVGVKGGSLGKDVLLAKFVALVKCDDPLCLDPSLFNPLLALATWSLTASPPTFICRSFHFLTRYPMAFSSKLTCNLAVNFWSILIQLCCPTSPSDRCSSEMNMSLRLECLEGNNSTSKVAFPDLATGPAT